MAQDTLFEDLLQRVRRGESEAACELVRRYESAVRMVRRTRLSDPALRRQFDSMDVCQSVLASFFFRAAAAAAGQYDRREPAQLVALLTQMARNKLAMRVRGASTSSVAACGAWQTTGPRLRPTGRRVAAKEAWWLCFARRVRPSRPTSSSAGNELCQTT